ncbi:MAG TPA: 16S rRNA (guanine(966)-N(2))-methyltransferase RsmD [Firmicutes bacterium]|nr:16S rRNA (guanine(966)-N(2))-methyltransferase RsmD [Bacillota bacterium]
MIKIIGGTYRSRILQTPDQGTLPTKNIVRGAMLSSLGDRIADSRVLDLFAGSGALGIETLSRGAKSCLFVEKDPKAANIVKGNLASLKESKGEVWNLDYQAALAQAKQKGMAFDIVFLDPPYAMKDAYRLSVDCLLQNGMLGEEACLILEYEGEIPFESPFPFQREYRYGKTKVLSLRRVL